MQTYSRFNVCLGNDDDINLSLKKSAISFSVQPLKILCTMSGVMDIKISEINFMRDLEEFITKVLLIGSMTRGQ